MPELASAIRAPFAPLTQPIAGAAKNRAVSAHSVRNPAGRGGMPAPARAAAIRLERYPLAAPPAATMENASSSVFRCGPCGKGFPLRARDRRPRSALFERSNFSIFFLLEGKGSYARRVDLVRRFIPRLVLRRAILQTPIDRFNRSNTETKTCVQILNTAIHPSDWEWVRVLRFRFQVHRPLPPDRGRLPVRPANLGRHVTRS